MKGRLIAGVLVIALGFSGCGASETAEAVVTTTIAAAFEMTTNAETTITVAETLLTTTAPTTTTIPETTTAYIRETSNDLPFSGEINADPLEYMKMLNISSGYGYMAFDDEYLYYAVNDDSEIHTSERGNPHQIYKMALDGTGEPIALLPDTDEIYYLNISNITVSYNRVYFQAIKMPRDLSEGDAYYIATIFSINTDGGDIRLELKDDISLVYIVDNNAYYFHSWAIYPGLIKYDMQTGERQRILDLDGSYSLVTDNIILYIGYVVTEDSHVFECYIIKLFDKNTSKELFSVDGVKYPSPTALYGDYLYCGSGEYINIKTLERGTFYDISDNEIIYSMNIYQNKLYFYVVADDGDMYTAKKLVSYDFSNGETTETELFNSKKFYSFEWQYNKLYSTPAGLYSYDENGRIFCVLK
jgi:hypothetical protein